MKNLKMLTMTQVLLGTMISISAFPQSIKGGGQGTYQNRKLMLMDTVEDMSRSARCEWVPMAQTLAEYPLVDKVLKKLEQVHAYAPAAIRSEAERVKICFAGQLRSLEPPPITIVTPGPYYGTVNVRQIPGSPPNPVFRRLNANLLTIGYRWNQKVIVDRKLFLELSDLNRAMFLIHEISHKFLPMNPEYSGGAFAATDSDPTPTVFDTSDAEIFTRRDRLWSFVNAIYQNYKKPEGISKESFSLAITQNGATLPETDNFWQKSSAAYAVALNRHSGTRARIQAIARLNVSDLSTNLVPADLEELNYFTDTWYTPVIEILKNRQYGWEAALTQQINTYGFVPTQTISDGSSMLTIAIQTHDEKALTLLLPYVTQTSDPAVRATFFAAVLDGSIPAALVPQVLQHFDPNAAKLIRTIENGIQVYQGEVAFFVVAIEQGNLDVARIFLESGRVNQVVRQQALSALVARPMGSTQYVPNEQEAKARNLFNALLQSPGSAATQELLRQATAANNQYAVHVILETIVPDAETLTSIVSSFSADNSGLEVLKEALGKPGVNVNSVDIHGNTMADYAIRNRNQIVFDLLIQAGATQFQHHRSIEITDFAVTRLIENNAGTALSNYLDGNHLNNQLDLLKWLDLAQLRRKPAAVAAIHAKLNPVR